MLCSEGVNPSRTCMRALLPICRISRCSARPLRRASPSGLRCDVMRKLRPARMRSATSLDAMSGLLIFLDVRQQLLNATGAGGSVVVAKIELRRHAQMDALAEEMSHT